MALILVADSAIVESFFSDYRRIFFTLNCSANRLNSLSVIAIAIPPHLIIAIRTGSCIGDGGGGENICSKCMNPCANCLPLFVIFNFRFPFF